ncbi:MAG: hypothetical protein E7508_09115 [Ruminococcus sp.]|nr:hypothetical protein [Ruminococcus sp.]
MSKQFTSTSKVCANCEFWGGARTFNRIRKCTECESPMTKGKCLNKSSGWANSPGKQADSNCAKWQKWGVLK